MSGGSSSSAREWRRARESSKERGKSVGFSGSGARLLSGGAGERQGGMTGAITVGVNGVNAIVGRGGLRRGLKRGIQGGRVKG
jgi:hypothetical protein